MDPGYILIVAILILGGVIATVGDRIGTKVGKARLSLFNLRPKNTAVLVTILTGSLISASTLGILFAADEGLRKGVFELNAIQRELKRKREEVQTTTQQLDTTQKEKTQVQAQLDKARTDQAQAQILLQRTNDSLQKAIIAQRGTQAQLNRTIIQQAQTQIQLQHTQSQLGAVVTQYQQAIGQLKSLYEQRNKLLAEIKERQKQSQQLYEEAKTAIAERDRELANRLEVIQQRDRKIAELDQLIQNRNKEITQREQLITQRESRVKQLEIQQEYLEGEVAKLDKSYRFYSQLSRDLRLGKLALVRGQELSEAVVRVTPLQARQAVIQLLEQANQNAIKQLSEPGEIYPYTQVLQVTNNQVDQLTNEIKDGREYVVRIFSAGNYVRGEKRIEFFADVALNQIVFLGGEVLASTTADPKTMTAYQVRERIELLIAACEFRARIAGISDDIQIDGTFVRFLDQISRYNQPIEIKAIAAQNTYRSGPLKVKLVAIVNGQIIFST